MNEKGALVSNINGQTVGVGSPNRIGSFKYLSELEGDAFHPIGIRFQNGVKIVVSG